MLALWPLSGNKEEAGGVTDCLNPLYGWLKFAWNVSNQNPNLKNVAFLAFVVSLTVTLDPGGPLSAKWS